MVMRVLVVARYKEKGYAPFVVEQVAALQKEGLDCRFFPVKAKGLMGYLRQFSSLRKAIRADKPDVIHAHYGLCGLLANMQRRVPVVTTYHGSDINEPSVLKLSKLAIRLSAFNVFVSQKCIDVAKPKKDYALIPCGINLEDFPIAERFDARRQLNLKEDGRYVLFAGAFDNAVKNAPLAKTVVGLFPDVELVELKGYTRPQVALLMQAVDALLMTSHAEGSPQVIKEALACGTPIVSVDVGDVKDRVRGVEGCYVSDEPTKESLVKCLSKALSFEGGTRGRDEIIDDGLDNGQVSIRLVEIYEKCMCDR